MARWTFAPFHSWKTWYYFAIRMNDELTTVCFKVKAPDLALLEALESHEDLRRSDIIRRAIRHYAEHLGVGSRPKPKRK